MTAADGEMGYNIDSRFAAPSQGEFEEENRIRYRSNVVYKMYPKDNVPADKDVEAKKTTKFDHDNTPLFRYFVPILNADKKLAHKKPFDVEMTKDKYTYTFHDLGGNLFALLDSGYKAVMEDKSPQMEAVAAAANSKQWLRKIAVYNRSIYPYCNPFSEYLTTSGPNAFSKRKALSSTLEGNGFSFAFEMGDGGFRVSKPLKNDAAVAPGTAGAVTYIGQGQLTPWQHNKCDVNTDITNANNFDQVQYTRHNESTNINDVLQRASTYHKSYWMLQLYNQDNFIIGTNGDEVLMAVELDKK
jgi:hypothetical protein